MFESSTSRIKQTYGLPPSCAFGMYNGEEAQASCRLRPTRDATCASDSGASSLLGFAMTAVRRSCSSSDLQSELSLRPDQARVRAILAKGLRRCSTFQIVGRQGGTYPCQATLHGSGPWEAKGNSVGVAQPCPAWLCKRPKSVGAANREEHQSRTA